MKLNLTITFIFVVAILACGQRGRKGEPAVDKWFVTEFQPLCDDSRGIFLDRNKLSVYGILTPYDTVQVKNGDSLTISFDFNTECCRNFSGDVDLQRDTLFLKYAPSNDTSRCDCYCGYRMSYRLRKGDKNWKAVKILFDEEVERHE